MVTFRKIVCPTDFSGPSYAALDDAAELAARFGAELIVVHVTQPIPPVIGVPPFPEHAAFDTSRYEEVIRKNADDRLREVLGRETLRGVKARAVARHGNPAEEIVAAADAEGADLIVIASHGETGWRRFIFGSVTERVLRLAEIPVLVTPTNDPDDAVG